VEVQRKDLENAGSNTAKVHKRLNCIGCLPDQFPGTLIIYRRKIAQVLVSNTWPGAGPKPIEECSNQMFQHFEIDLYFKAVPSLPIMIGHSPKDKLM